MIKNIVIGALVVAVVVLGLALVGSSANVGRFTDEYNPKVFKDTVSMEGAVAVSGALTQSGALTASADVRLKQPVSTGATTTLTAGATTSISAANACDKAIVNFEPITGAVGTTTLPTAAAMAADCLTTDGDSKVLLFRNLSSATTTQFVFGDTATGTIIVGEAATNDVVAASGWERLTFIRLGAATMAVYLETLVDAD